MKIHTLVVAILAGLAANSFGNVVTFGNADLSLDVDWKTYGFTDNASTVNTATIVQDGITFALTATTSANLDLNTAGDLWGVNGGGNNTRVDDGNTPEESVTFTISVSGAPLGSLSFKSMELRYFANSYEQVDLSDGTTTLPTLSGGSASTWVDYDTELSGLTALTAANVGSWQLTVTAVDSLDPGIGATDFGFTEISFEYTLDTGPQAPVANDDTYEAEKDTLFTNAAPGVLSNDTDGNSDPLTAIQLTSPTNGTLVEFPGDGSFIYQSDPGFTGTDSFTYQATDGGLTSGVATVTLNVSGTPVTLPLIFQSNMVFQRNKPITVWGWGPVGNTVSVSLSSGQAGTAPVGADGRWKLSLASMAATNGPLTLVVSVPGSSVTLTNLAVGDVWFCSGQSNAGWSLSSTDGSDEEIAAANHPNFRLIRVPRYKLDAPSNDPIVPEDTLDWDPETGDLKDKAGKWFVCSPDTAGDFGAVFYYMGKELQLNLDIPIGIIQSAYAGTPVEAWAKTPLPEAHPIGADPADPHQLYNGMVYPYLNLPITGACWYQGERNHDDGGHIYADKLSIMIDDWRTGWAQGNFPFYYLQIPPVFEWNTEVDADPMLPYFWEAQTLVMEKSTNTYMVVISDTTDGRLHPRNKRPVGERVALRALKNTYGFSGLVDSGPVFTHAAFEGNQMRLYFDETGGGLALNTNVGYNANGDLVIDIYEDLNNNGVLDTGEDYDKDGVLDRWGEDLNQNGIFDDGEDLDGDGIMDLSEQEINFPYLTWFELCGPEGVFTNASAVIDGDTVVLSAPSITNPVGFRYAWSRFAIGNLMNAEGLPARLARLVPPIAQGDGYDIEMDGKLYVDPAGILANDAPASSLLPIQRPIITSSVSNGTLMLRRDGAFLYEPKTGFIGTDRFTYVASDGVEDSPAEATVTIEVLPPGPETGQINRDVWTGITGYLISDLTSLPTYPDSPDETGFITALDAPVDWGDNYGQRIYGYLHPPTNGNYTFFISSAARSEFWLSTDEDPANLVRICKSLSVDPGEWTSHLTPVTLVGGQRYFIELLHKENSNVDHATVAWDMAQPGTTNIIDGIYLSGIPAEIPATSGYADWSNWYGVSGDEYLLDFAFNLDPTLNSGQIMVPTTGTAGLPYWEVLAVDGLAVEYLRRKDAPGTTYAVQFSDSLTTNWTDSVAVETVSPINGTWERVTVEDEVDIATATNRFGRVIVIQD